MREDIQRTTCNQCKQTHEHIINSYGRSCLEWFTLFVPDLRTRIMVEHHFCCFLCLWEWVKANNPQ